MLWPHIQLLIFTYLCMLQTQATMQLKENYLLFATSPLISMRVFSISKKSSLHQITLNTLGFIHVIILASLGEVTVLPLIK